MNKEIALALSKAQAEMPVIPMNAKNPFLKNKYADLGSVIDTVRPVLAKYELAFSQIPVGSGGEVGVKTILMHSSGEFIEDTITLPISAEKGKSSAQVAGSIITYLRRYSLSAILGVYADEDIDGNAPNGSSETAQKKAPTTAKIVLHTTDNAPTITPQFLVDNSLSSNVAHAAAIVNGLKIAGKPASDENFKIISKYREFQTAGMKDKEAFEKTQLWAIGA